MLTTSMTIDPTDISISVTAELTEDVERGVYLYGVENGNLKGYDDLRAKRWAKALFRDNNVGKGLFAFARHKGELIGFISLIDMEMMIRGVSVKAGKAEFWVVKRDLLKIFLPGKDTRIPWTLFETLRRSAGDHGYGVVLTVSGIAARYLRRAGDLRIHRDLDCYFADAETVGALPKWDVTAFHITTLNEIPSQPKNALVASTPAMIGFRFPDRIKLLVPRAYGDHPALFVFDRNEQGALTLVHWSRLPTSVETFIAVLRRAGQLAQTESISLEIPSDQIPSCYDLESFGFKKTSRKLNDCFLMDTKGTLRLDELDNWHVTHGHMRFYQSIL
jgi:hypothetical protein